MLSSLCFFFSSILTQFLVVVLERNSARFSLVIVISCEPFNSLHLSDNPTTNEGFPSLLLPVVPILPAENRLILLYSNTDKRLRSKTAAFACIWEAINFFASAIFSIRITADDNTTVAHLFSHFHNPTIFKV